MSNDDKTTNNDHLQSSDSNTTTVDNEVSSVRAIRVPMPPIVPDNMEMWFLQLEHWFKVVGITGDNTKFSTVIAALDATLLQQVYSVVRNPPTSNRYQAITEAIVHNFADSEQQRIQQLISGIQLGDRKPSHLLNDLRRVAGDVQDEKLLKGLWMKRLPVEVQICLETVSVPLSELSVLADSVMETFRVGSESHINMASSTSVISRTPIEDPIIALTNEVKRLSTELARFKRNVNQRSRSRSLSRPTNRNRNHFTTNSTRDANTSTGEDEFCWYHRKYGNDSRKCKSPCAWPPKN